MENQHQDLAFANAARDRMLKAIDFGSVTFLQDLPNKVKSAEHHPVRSYLLANGIESNGRVLALVYTGTPTLAAVDGDKVFVDEQLLEASVYANQTTLGNRSRVGRPRSRSGYQGPPE